MIDATEPTEELSAEELAKLPRGDGRLLLHVLRQIWKEQKERGFIPSTQEEVETMIREGREDRDHLWDSARPPKQSAIP